MDKNLVLVVFAKILVPFILLFALYVQFHGDFGPGGGFQAGVIFATGLILYALVQGVDRAMAVMPPAVLKPMMALGVLIYGGVGIATMLLGGHFLDYGLLAHDPLHGQHYGILIIELGVGITVAAVMMVIFYAFIGEQD